MEVETGFLAFFCLPSSQSSPLKLILPLIESRSSVFVRERKRENLEWGKFPTFFALKKAGLTTRVVHNETNSTSGSCCSHSIFPSYLKKFHSWKRSFVVVATPAIVTENISKSFLFLCAREVSLMIWRQQIVRWKMRLKNDFEGVKRNPHCFYSLRIWWFKFRRKLRCLTDRKIYMKSVMLLWCLNPFRKDRSRRYYV